VPRRIERQRKDPWQDYFTLKQRLSLSAIRALSGLT